MTAIRLVNGKMHLLNGKAALVGAGVVSPPAGTGTLAFSSQPLNQQVFQRVGTAKLLPVSGTLSGQVTQVQARAVPAGTDIASTAYAWTDVPTNTTASTFSGSLSVQQGGWYVWQVRDKTNTNIAATGANKWGVGIVIGLIGQSNMANFNSTPAAYPLNDPLNVQYNTDGAFHRVGNISPGNPPNATFYGPPPNYPGGYTNDGGSVSDGPVYLGNLIAEGMSIPVCTVNRAIGGTSIASWLVSANTNWNGFRDAINAMGGDCEVVLWYQGENDVGSNLTTYESNLAAIQQQCLTLTGRTTSNFHFGLISLGPITTTSGYANSQGGVPNDLDVGRMRATQVHYARSNAGAFLASCSHDGVAADGDVHIDGDSHGRLGRREALTILARFGIGKSGAGPRVLSAARTGTQLDVTFAHSGGAALKDAAGGTGTALTGFEYLDANGNPVGITPVGITGSNTARFTLASAVAGTLSYAMHNCPHNSNPANAGSARVPASILVDDVTYINGTEGCPLQPCAAITVTGI